MLPTFTLQLSDMKSMDIAPSGPLNLMPDGVSDEIGSFSDLMKLGYGEALVTPLKDGEALPVGGNDLPPELQEIVDELVNVLDLPTPVSDADIAAEIPESLVTQLQLFQLTPTAENQLLGDESSLQWAAELPISQLASLVGEQVRLLQQTDQSLQNPEKLEGLRELATLLRQRVTTEATNPVTAQVQSLDDSPIPAATVRIDGIPRDGKSDRFRALGVGIPVNTDAEVTRPVGDLAPRPGFIPEYFASAADPVRNELAATIKPLTGGLQVHAPTITANAGPASVGIVAATTTDPSPTGLTSLSETISTPVREPGWGDKLGERVLLMASNRLQNADLRLTPAEMGPLRIRISLEEGAANVSFVTQHAVTREVIEQALPRLRNLLAQNGIDLGQASVGQQERDLGNEGLSGDQAESGEQAQNSAAESDATTDSDTPLSMPQRISRGLLDTFV